MSDAIHLAATAEHDLMDERMAHRKTKAELEAERAHRHDLVVYLHDIKHTVWYRIGRALRLCP
ncbi:MAG: hypothetical protein AB7U75_14400 [Hyphomicrobiaceae bacterium]